MTARRKLSAQINDTRLATLYLAAQAYSHLHGLAYAQLSPDLILITLSPNFERLAGSEAAQGRSLFDVLPEFVGLEADIAAVQARRAAEVRLERVNREAPDGAINYLDFYIVPLAEPEPGLLVIIEDVTLLGQLEQLVQQAHNDLRLMQREVAHTRAELRRLQDGT